MRPRLLALRAAGVIAVLAAGPVLCCTGVALAGDAGTAADPAKPGVPAKPGASARAGGSVRVTLSPVTAVPGGELEIRVEGCERSPATADSTVFVTEAALSGRDEGRGVPLSGETTIRSSAAPGRYEVRVGCDGRTPAGSAVLRIGAPAASSPVASSPAASSPATSSPAVSSPAASSPAVFSPGVPAPAPARPGPAARLPVALPASGGPGRAGGDKAPHAVPDDHKGTRNTRKSGPGTPQTVIGLVLAGVTAVAVAVRSARRQRGTTKDAD